MSSPGSVSRWIAALKVGDRSAAWPLWERYHRHLVALARKMLRSARRRMADEDDVVQNAFHSFFRALELGRFPQLENRDNLWRLLVDITANKVRKQIAHDQRLKRGGGTFPGPTGIYSIGWLSEQEAAVSELAASEPAPDLAAQVADECGRLLNVLGDESLRQVAVWKLEGYSNDEIAHMLGCSRRTVARKLEAIRVVWRKEYVK